MLPIKNPTKDEVKEVIARSEHKGRQVAKGLGYW